MLKHIGKFLPFLLIVLPYLFVFKAFFVSGPLVWGDAPYFFLENLHELFQKPLVWDFRNSNFGSSQAQVLWLYLPTFLMGFLAKLGLNNDIAVRLIFYFPATMGAILGSWILIKKFVQNSLAATLGSILYTFNTYFLLLIDGGQIGSALSYGIFPISLCALLLLQEKFSAKNIFLATLSLFVLLNTDLRTAVLLLLVYLLLNLKKLLFSIKTISLTLTFSLMLSAYWLVPFLFSKPEYLTQSLSSDLPNNFFTFWNGFLLYNPHFPLNEFGKSTPIPWYFYLLPLLLISHFRLFVLFLFFVFLSSIPFGPLRGVFELIVNNIPFVFAFRDSTKFFIPAILIASILLAKTVARFKSNFVGVIVYLYLLLLILPSLTGGLTGVLAGREFGQDYQKIYGELNKDQNYFRSVWFPERPPLGFSASNKEGLSAGELYKERPFALMIEGTYDLFNFLHDSKLPSWFEILGVKYAFFPPDPRQKTTSAEDFKNRQLFLEFIETLGFKKLDWGTSFPVYEVSAPREKIYGQEKIILVVGDGSFYDNFDFKKAGVLFLEDGLIDPAQLLSLPQDSSLLYFNQSGQQDLILSFLQNYFLKSSNVQSNNWGKYQRDEILENRYELLQHGIKNLDFDFSQGIYFSSIKGEQLRFKVDIPQNDRYLLAIRSLAATDSAGIKVEFASLQKIIKNQGQKFKWDLIGPVELDKGSKFFSLQNLGGFQAVNVISLFTETDFNNAKNLSRYLIDKFYVDDLSRVSLQNLKKINYQQKNPTEYTLNLVDQKPQWIIFSDHFDKGWVLRGSGAKSFPIYSMINGFWIDSPKETLTLYYSPQDLVMLGSWVSFISAGVFIVSLLFFRVKK